MQQTKREDMRILVTGSNGQLGQYIQEIVRRTPNLLDEYIFASKDDLDITDRESVEKYFNSNVINLVINCAAYTNVEKADEEKTLAWKVNSYGVENLRDVCSARGIFIIHISTDYVFDGINQGTPYLPTDEAHTNNVYGKTKREGEEKLSQYENSLVIRTSWLYGEKGGNFFTTVLNKIKNGETIRVVDDQIGTPTYARDLAEFIVLIVEKRKYNLGDKIIHFTNSGVASWYDFAFAINLIYLIRLQLSSEKEEVYEPYRVYPCSSKEYPSKVFRPSYSVLSKECLKIYEVGEVRHWIDALSDCFRRL